MAASLEMLFMKKTTVQTMISYLLNLWGFDHVKKQSTNPPTKNALTMWAQEYDNVKTTITHHNSRTT
jgi:hypothetical protein